MCISEGMSILCTHANVHRSQNVSFKRRFLLKLHDDTPFDNWVNYIYDSTSRPYCSFQIKKKKKLIKRVRLLLNLKVVYTIVISHLILELEQFLKET
jgi:hypothetical protein